MTHTPANYRIYDDPDEHTVSEIEYVRGIRRKYVLMAAAAAALPIVALITLLAGNADYASAADVLTALLTHDTSPGIGRYVWRIDLPIMAAAAITGAALSLSGTVMQCILKNPLASPYTLGLSNAAAFGAAYSVIFLGGGASFSGILGDYCTPLTAFISAMAATGIVLLLSKVVGVSSETMVLAGIAVSAVFSAGLTLMQYIADPVQLSSIVSWTFGSVSSTDRNWNLFLIVSLVPIAAYFCAVRWKLNAMNAGDEAAKGLGVDTDKMLTVGMTLSALMAATVVSRFGVIAFVGLLGPHAAKILVGEDHRFLIPASMLTGALLLTSANAVALNIVLPMILPVGLLTSLIGGPVFICMLIGRYRK